MQEKTLQPCKRVEDNWKIDEFFQEIEKLDAWYDFGYITLSQYYEIKGRIIDIYNSELD